MRQMSKEKKKAWIAISGTMASGKSSVLRYLSSLGYPVFDCDAINADLQRKGQKGYKEIIAYFGKDILNEEDEINRQKLAEVVFSDSLKRKKLEGIMHPMILERLNEIRNNMTRTSFAEVPLLYELGWEKYFDEDWLIAADDEKLLERCVHDRHMDEKAAVRRITAQMKTSDKKRKAAVVIENNDDLESLYQKIDELLERRRHE